MSASPQPTPLQQAQQAISDALLDAREALDERAYAVLLEILCALVAREVARVARWRLEEAA